MTVTRASGDSDGQASAARLGKLLYASPTTMNSLEEKKIDDTLHVEGLESNSIPTDSKTVEAVGHLGNEEEHQETAMEALRKYPWTIVWMCYGIYLILACAFDNSAAGSVVGLPRFRQDFGYAFAGDYVIPANWQSAWSGAPNAAQVLGTFTGGCKCISSLILKTSPTKCFDRDERQVGKEIRDPLLLRLAFRGYHDRDGCEHHPGSQCRVLCR